MDAISTLLARIPLATVLTLLVYITAVYAIVAGKIVLDSPDDFLKFFGGLSAITVANSALGKVRNDAGHGTKP